MADKNRKEIAQGVLSKMAEFRNSCEGLDEENSSRASSRLSYRSHALDYTGPRSSQGKKAESLILVGAVVLLWLIRRL